MGNLVASWLRRGRGHERPARTRGDGGHTSGTGAGVCTHGQRYVWPFATRLLRLRDGPERSATRSRGRTGGRRNTVLSGPSAWAAALWSDRLARWMLVAGLALNAL